MRQQINLYRTEFSSRVAFPDFNGMLAMVLVALALILLMAGFSYWQTVQIKGQLQRLAVEQSQVEQQLQGLQQKIGRVSSAPLEREIGALREKRDRLMSAQDLFGGLASQGKLSGNKQGFSRQMESLAERHIAGIALSRIELQSGGRQVSLAGETQLGELVPKYLAKLDNDAAFSGSSFGQVSIDRDLRSGKLQFSIRPQPVETAR